MLVKSVTSSNRISYPFLKAPPNVHILQHDNARPHTTQVTVNFQINQGVKVLPWPSYSQSLNLIEHLWDELDAFAEGVGENSTSSVRRHS